MQIGFIGLGRMGANMTLRLLRAKHSVAAFDQGRRRSRPRAPRAPFRRSRSRRWSWRSSRRARCGR